MTPLVLLAGSSVPELASAVGDRIGTPLGTSPVERFPDGETGVLIEEPVAGRDVVIVQSTSAPVNDHLMELLFLADAARRADAASITAVVPYFGYSRSDRRASRRTTVSARVVADAIEASGVTRLVTVDAHTAQLEGFFRISFQDLDPMVLLAEAVSGQISGPQAMVSPDLGRVETATRWAERFGVTAAAVHKRRISGAHVEVGQVLGDVRGKRCVIVDDMISTGGTVLESIGALREAGAHDEFTVVATHGVLADGAVEALLEAGVTEIWTTDTIAPSSVPSAGVQRVSVAPLLASALEAMRVAPTPPD